MSQAKRFRVGDIVTLPAVLYALRLAASVCLALYVAFWLQLDNPTWAGTSAGITCQPILGASLRKAGFRVVGTLTGAVFIVTLTACFPQDRVGFIVGLALWGAACAFVNTLLQNFAAYAAALSGYTAAIIAGDALNSPDQTFNLAVARASEISLGVVAATLVVSLTTFGHSRRQLGVKIAAIATETLDDLAESLAVAGIAEQDTRPARRALIKRAIALSPLMDQALGEASDLRRQQPTLQAGVDGLFGALAAWRSVALHLSLMPAGQARSAAGVVRRALPSALNDVQPGRGALPFLVDPADARDGHAAAAKALAAAQTADPSTRLLLDQTAEALTALARSSNAVALLVTPHKETRVHFRSGWNVPDLLPPLVNALRVFLTIATAALFWVATAWPGGASLVTFSFITVILLSPQNEEAYSAAFGFAAGVAIAAVLAGVLKFAVQPAQQGYIGFALTLSLFLVPIAVLSQVSPLKAIVGPAAFNFVPLLGATNEPTYDTLAFYNAALPIVSGCMLAAIALRLVPPVPPALRAARLLTATLRGIRRLAQGAGPFRADAWRLRIYGRLAVLPEVATPTQRAHLITAFAVGDDIIRLRMAAHRFGLASRLEPALALLAAEDSAGTIAALAEFDQALADLPASVPGGNLRLHARASILNLADALRTHADYFDGTRAAASHA